MYTEMFIIKTWVSQGRKKKKAHDQDSCTFSLQITIKYINIVFNLALECQHPRLFAMTSAVCPIFLFAMTVSSQWSSTYCVLLRASYDSQSESSLGVTHG